MFIACGRVLSSVSRTRSSRPFWHIVRRYSGALRPNYLQDWRQAFVPIKGSIATAALDDFSGCEPSAVHLPDEIAPNIDLVSAETKHALTEFSRPHLAAKPDQFFNDDYVIDTEGPLHESVLVRRIARHHGFKKAGCRIRERVSAIAKSRRGSTVESVGRFYWQKGTIKEKFT